MTTRSARLCALILVSLAACGDDGNALNAVCGDSTREGAEQCDDGNTASGDGCSASCTTELTMSCGNGAVEGTEQCDDGNATNGDGCSSTCQTETQAGCGNGATEGTEQCDDGNTTSGDGCSSTCRNETPAGCGNGTVASPETCDDGNTTAGDGCSSVCATEPGYTCTGNPSVCTVVTPAGTCAAPFVVNLTATGNILSGTGTGNQTGSTNQVAAAICNGMDATTGTGKDHVWRFTTTDVRDISIVINGTTAFDSVLRILAVPCDPTMEVDEFTGADGCDDSLTDPTGEFLEYTALPPGTYYVVIDGYDATDAGAYSFTVTARPTLCGNGALDPVSALPNSSDEFCDDNDAMSGDGCNARCEEEPGFTCNTAEPSVCTQTCGNGTIDAGETCDDGGTVAGNGCSAVCQTEPGYLCTGTPSVCALSCGNGVINSGETCDDGGTTAGNGCSATCQTEVGYTCTGTPSVCVLTCGNGVVNTGETCDDGGTTAGNGCSGTCQTEPGYTCTGTPSVCTFTCGNGTKQPTEECEDGNLTNGDRCSSTCTLEFDVLETEPGNNTTPQVLTAGDHIIRGALTAGDVDLYRFTLTSPRIVHLETYDAMDNLANYTGLGTLPEVDCLVDDTVVRLFAPSGVVTMNGTALASDDDDGDVKCSYIGPNDGNDLPGTDPTQGYLPAGTYTIKVAHFDSTGTSSRYILDLYIEPTVAPLAGELVINEIMAADNASDTNCDGSTTDVFDEFVELVNVSSFTLDLAGVTISEAGAPTVPRHVFAAGTTVNPGQAVVVWGGGTPNCLGVTNFAVASAGLLSLSDTGDTVTVATGGVSSVTIDSYTFTDAEAEINVSLNLSPDVTGTVYALHTAVAGAVGAFSPGKLSDGTAF